MFGAWHKEAEAILKRLGLSLAHAIGGDEAEVTRHFFGCLSMILQRDNVNMILLRSPTTTVPEVDGSI